MKKKTKKKMSRGQKELMSLCIVPVLFVFVFSYLPMFGVLMAFKNYKYDLGILKSPWVGFDNFMYFFNGDDFWRLTRNTLTLNFVFIVVGMLSALIFAIMLYELKSRRTIKIYQTIAITPTFISWVIVGFVSYIFLHPENGIINLVLEKLGMEGIDWYSTPRAWPIILTIFFVWKNAGMDAIIYYATMMGLDAELYEAAALDGANRFKQAIYITIPGIVPVLITMFILKIGNIFRADFGLFYQLTRNCGALYSTTDVMDTYIYRTMRVFGDMSTSAAMGLLQSVVGFVTVIIANAIVKRIDSDKSMF